MSWFDGINLISETMAGISRRNTYEVKCIDFELNGFQCVAVRTDMGHWTGYVVIPKEHQDYLKDYNSFSYDVHGGITFGDYIHWKDTKNKGKWALGFDFMHSGDDGGSEEDVKEECRKLTSQLATVGEVSS